MVWFHGQKKRGKSNKGTTSASLLFLVTGAHWVFFSLTVSGLETIVPLAAARQNRKAWEMTDVSKAYQRGQCRLVHDTSTGVLPFCTLGGIVCQHPPVWPILFAGSLFCFLHWTTESKPRSSTVSTVCLQKQTVIITKYWHGAEREKA